MQPVLRPLREALTAKGLRLQLVEVKGLYKLSAKSPATEPFAWPTLAIFTLPPSTSSSPNSQPNTHTGRNPMNIVYSFCEASTAGSRSRWHIRPLNGGLRKLGGGVDSSSLCGHVDRRRGGWDLKPEVRYPSLADSCPECRAAYVREVVLGLFRKGPVEYPFDGLTDALGLDKRASEALREPLYQAYFAALEARIAEGTGAIQTEFATAVPGILDLVVEP